MPCRTGLNSDFSTAGKRPPRVAPFEAVGVASVGIYRRRNRHSFPHFTHAPHDEPAGTPGTGRSLTAGA
jgi:hypothetical protein